MLYLLVALLAIGAKSQSGIACSDVSDCAEYVEFGYGLCINDECGACATADDCNNSDYFVQLYSGFGVDELECTEYEDGDTSTGNDIGISCFPPSCTVDGDCETGQICTPSPLLPVSFCAAGVAGGDCSDDDGCPLAATPRCDTGTSTCVECFSDTDCDAFWAPEFPICNEATYVCEADSDTATGCTMDSQCSSDAYSRCDTISGECVECFTDADCTDYWADLGYPRCSTDLGGVCLPEACTEDADCTGRGENACETTSGLCYTGCSTDADCIAILESYGLSGNPTCEESDTFGVKGCACEDCSTPEPTTTEFVCECEDGQFCTYIGCIDEDEQTDDCDPACSDIQVCINTACFAIVDANEDAAQQFTIFIGMVIMAIAALF